MRLHFFNSAVTANSKLDYSQMLYTEGLERLRRRQSAVMQCMSRHVIPPAHLGKREEILPRYIIIFKDWLYLLWTVAFLPSLEGKGASSADIILDLMSRRF